MFFAKITELISKQFIYLAVELLSRKYAEAERKRSKQTPCCDLLVSGINGVYSQMKNGVLWME